MKKIEKRTANNKPGKGKKEIPANLLLILVFVVVYMRSSCEAKIWKFSMTQLYFMFILSFKGAAVSFDVRHSKVMGRQYINIGLTPTVKFKRKTSGLYGYMDGDPSNDLQGPDGKIYTDPIKFAESCKFLLIKCLLKNLLI